MLENTEGAIKNGQSRELATYSTQDEEKPQYNIEFDTTMRKQIQIT
jgi:hypothetical protein